MLKEFWAVFDEAWNRRDAGAVAALFEDAAQFSFIDGRSFSGRNAIEEFYREGFSRMQGALTHEATVAQGKGVSGHGAFRIISADERTEVLVGHYEIELSARRLILGLTLKK